MAAEPTNTGQYIAADPTNPEQYFYGIKSSAIWWLNTCIIVIIVFIIIKKIGFARFCLLSITCWFFNKIQNGKI